MARKLNVFRNPFEKAAMGENIPNDVGENSYPLVESGDPPQAQFNRWNTERSVQEGFKSSEWVYVAVSRIATAASSVPWKVYQKTQDGRQPYLVRGKIHPLEDLITNPNPYINGGDWIELLTQHLYLGGNAVNKVVMLGGMPVSILPVMPDTVDVIPGKKAIVDFYDVWKDRSVGKKPERLNASEVIHIKFSDPSNLYWGTSPLQAVARTVDTDVEAIKWNKISLQNRAVSDGAFIVNQAITPDQWTQLRKMVREQHQGPKNAHTPWVLGYGMDWKPMSMTPQELDFINSRRMNRESILAVYNVPPPVAGLYDSATFNNISTARKSFWLDTVIPYLDNLRAALTFYFKQFPGFGSDYIIDYDLSGVEALKPEFKDRVDAAKVLWTMGVPVNVLNQRFELDLPIDMEYADTAFVAGVKSAKDVVAGTPIAPNAPVSDPNASPTATPTNEGRGLETFAIADATTLSGRDMQWAINDKHRTKYEESLTKVVGILLLKDYKKYANQFAQDGRITPLNTDHWKSTLLSLGAAIVLDAGTRTIQGIKQETSANGTLETFDDSTFDLTAEVTQFLDDWIGVRAEQYMQYTIDQCYRIIKTGQDEGLTPREIATNIEDAGVLSEYRAVRIGGTEAVGLQNYSIIEAAKQSKVVENKVWISSRDSRVRDSHKETDGQTVPIAEKFSVGDVMMNHPADYQASAGESVNCRCTVSFVLKNANGSTLGRIKQRMLSF